MRKDEFYEQYIRHCTDVYIDGCFDSFIGFCRLIGNSLYH